MRKGARWYALKLIFFFVGEAAGLSGSSSAAANEAPQTLPELFRGGGGFRSTTLHEECAGALKNLSNFFHFFAAAPFSRQASLFSAEAARFFSPRKSKRRRKPLVPWEYKRRLSRGYGIPDIY